MISQRLRRLWPRRLAGQMIALVLLVLTLALGISVWLLSGAHRESFGALSQGQLLKQYVSIVKLLESSEPEYHKTILRATRNTSTRVHIDDSSTLSAQPETDMDRRLQARLLGMLGPQYQGRIRASIGYRFQLPTEKQLREYQFSEEEQRGRGPDRARHMTERQRRMLFERSMEKDQRTRPRLEYLSISLKTKEDRWLNFDMVVPKPPALIPRQTLIFLLLAGGALMIALLWMVRRIATPVKSLSTAANRMGRGETLPPLQEQGPEEIRELTRAFNQMQDRQQRFVSDRTRMLAAFSHDLRTPITSLRLRVEMMEPSEHQQRLLDTLDEMQQMSEATLAFVRDGSDTEATRQVDLNALLDSLCDDLAEQGKAVRFSESEQSAVIACRPLSLKRALRNLIENAVQYGEQADVAITADNQTVKITIRDQGPGIAPDKIEQVFEPFFRLESSRNRHTGGVGLGMSIARNILRSHGGDIQLQNQHPGLLITLTIPNR
ncbi:ATP-binding protein [Ferrimonas pelagia]|uniref:histidine kinase n=1 Tax=Ferrimonas pelagia TaxID=1177826 RepID=A0ABP9FGA9_9GAMM